MEYAVVWFAFLSLKDCGGHETGYYPCVYRDTFYEETIKDDDGVTSLVRPYYTSVDACFLEISRDLQKRDAYQMPDRVSCEKAVYVKNQMYIKKVSMY